MPPLSPCDVGERLLINYVRVQLPVEMACYVESNDLTQSCEQ